MASKEMYHLLRVLDERDLGLGRDDVAWAFDSAETKRQIETWVQDYLQLPTLLTKEENFFYGRVGGHISQTLPSTSSRPLSDEDFEQAISSLESSTAAIEKQCLRMEAQKQALQELKARNAASDETRDAYERQQTKAARDRAQLDFEVDELASTLQSQLRGSLKQTETVNVGLPSTIQRVLEKDDRMLDGMQKVLPKLGGQSDNTGALGEVDRLCDAFPVLEAKAIRARIDATYRAHAPTLSSQANGHTSNTSSHDDQKDGILAELDELSSEIDGLVALVVENHYRQPITRGLQNATVEIQGESARWSSYLAATLQYLTGRLESLEEHTRQVRGHQAAVSALSATLDDMSSASGHDRSKPEPTTTSAAQKAGLKPLRLVQANMSDALDPASQLLRLLDIKTPNNLDSAQLARLLEEVKAARQAKLRNMTSTTDGAIAKGLTESLGKADVGARDLLSAVYAHTEYNDRRLVDPDVQAGVDGLEDKTRALGERMRGLDLDSLGSDVRRLQRRLLS